MTRILYLFTAVLDLLTDKFATIFRVSGATHEKRCTMNLRGSITLAFVVHLLWLNDGTSGRPTTFSIINTTPLTNETHTTESRTKPRTTSRNNDYEVDEYHVNAGLEFDNSSSADLEEAEKQNSETDEEAENGIDQASAESQEDGALSQERVPPIVSPSDAEFNQFIGTNGAEHNEEFVALKRNGDPNSDISSPSVENTAPPVHLSLGRDTDINLEETNDFLGSSNNEESNFNGPGGGFAGVRPAENEPTPRQTNPEPSESSGFQNVDQGGTLGVDTGGGSGIIMENGMYITEETPTELQPQLSQNSEEGTVPESQAGSSPSNADDNAVPVGGNQEVPLELGADGGNTLDHPIDFGAVNDENPQHVGSSSPINHNNDPAINNSDGEMVDTNANYENTGGDGGGGGNDDYHNNDNNDNVESGNVHVDEVATENELNSSSVHASSHISGGYNVPLIISPVDQSHKYFTHDSISQDVDQNETQSIGNRSDNFETPEHNNPDLDPQTHINPTQSVAPHISSTLSQSISPAVSLVTPSISYSSSGHQDLTTPESWQGDHTRQDNVHRSVSPGDLLPSSTFTPVSPSSETLSSNFFTSTVQSEVLTTVISVSTANVNNVEASLSTIQPSATLAFSSKSAEISTESASAEPNAVEEVTSDVPPEEATTSKSTQQQLEVTNNSNKEDGVDDLNTEVTTSGHSESPQLSTPHSDLERNITGGVVHGQGISLSAATTPSSLLPPTLSSSSSSSYSTTTTTASTRTTTTAAATTSTTSTPATTKLPTTRIAMNTTAAATTPSSTTITITTTARSRATTPVTTQIQVTEDTVTTPTTSFRLTERSTNGAVHPPEVNTNGLRPEMPEIVTTTVMPTTSTTTATTATTTTAQGPDSEIIDKLSSTTVTLTDRHIPTEGVPTVLQPGHVMTARASVTTVTSGNAIHIPPEMTIKPDNRITPSGNTLATPVVPAQGLDLPPSFVELKFGMSWPDFCDHEVSIRGELVEILHVQGGHCEITADQIQVINREQEECYQLNFSVTEEILVHLYLMNKSHHYDRGLTLVCARILESGLELGETSIIRNKLIDVRFHNDYYLEPATGATVDKSEDKASRTPFSDPGVTIAIVLAVVGGCCCVGLIAIQIFRRRNRDEFFPPGFNRSFSVTSSDSIQLASVNKSRPNSGLFNPGLDLSDPPDPTHPLNFTQLANFCTDENQMTAEFQKLPNRMPRLSVVPAGDEDKNRYANVLPLTQTRVKLLQDGAEPRSSYINASFVSGPNNECQYYIATQAPTKETIADFWTMVWQQGCKAVVMLTQLEEEGQSKCEAYFPELVGKSAAQKHGDFLIELKQKDVHQEYIASKLEINNLRKIEKREIDHFWYTCWPPSGMPEPISLVKLVLDTRPKFEGSGAPLVVHCSPGTGRTCTFIALDLCMRQFEARRVVDVMKTVNVMRQERAGAIQNKEQYCLLYNAINEYATIVVSPVVSAASSATTLHALLQS